MLIYDPKSHCSDSTKLPAAPEWNLRHLLLWPEACPVQCTYPGAFLPDHFFPYEDVSMIKTLNSQKTSISITFRSKSQLLFENHLQQRYTIPAGTSVIEVTNAGNSNGRLWRLQFVNLYNQVQSHLEVDDVFSPPPNIELFGCC